MKRHEFKAKPNSLLQGHWCLICVEYSFNKIKPATLYYLKVTYKNNIYYKIGITNCTVKERFSIKDLRKIEVVRTWKYENGEDAWKKEQEILKDFNEYKYKGNEQILESGNIELFIKDVLGLDVGN